MRATLLSLIPDAGHLIPLLRIGVLLKKAGHNVEVICPTENEPLVDQTGIPATLFGKVRPPSYTEEIGRLCAASDLQRSLFARRRFEVNYFQPLQAEIFGRLDEALADVRASQPSILITDDHLLESAYRWIASQCSVPLVLHYSAGTRFRSADPARWETDSRHSSAILETISRTLASWSIRYERFCRPQAYRRKKSRQEFLNMSWQKLEREAARLPNESLHIGTGTAVLEDEHLPLAIDPSRRDRMISLPPAPPLDIGTLGAELSEWLAQKPGVPVVYVCFGTMASGIVNFSHRILAACERLGVRVLWAGAQPPSRNYDPLYVRWETWVPQCKVLAHATVRAFVSHAGAGSVQESLWYGKPLLCIPLLWDQPYNAWMVQSLGAGVTLHREAASSVAVRGALHDLLLKDDLAASASALSKEIRSPRRQNDLISFFANINAKCGSPQHPA